jgi:poly(A) polymerase Pap1
MSGAAIQSVKTARTLNMIKKFEDNMAFYTEEELKKISNEIVKDMLDVLEAHRKLIKGDNAFKDSILTCAVANLTHNFVRLRFTQHMDEENKTTVIDIASKLYDHVISEMTKSKTSMIGIMEKQASCASEEELIKYCADIKAGLVKI